MFVAGYHDGKITAVHTHQDGRLGQVFDGVFHKGVGSVAERNFRPHVSCVKTTPEGKYVCAVDNGIDQVRFTGSIQQEIAWNWWIFFDARENPDRERSCLVKTANMRTFCSN